MFASRVYVAIASLMSSLRCGYATTWKAVATRSNRGTRRKHARAGEHALEGGVDGVGLPSPSHGSPARVRLLCPHEFS